MSTSDVIDFLRRSYLGPFNGASEISTRRPDKTYLVGTLYPTSSAAASDSDDTSTDLQMDEWEDPIVELSNAWSPSSAAMSFIHTGPSISCRITFGTYSEMKEKGQATTWHRSAWAFENIMLSPSKTTWTERLDSVFDVELISKWRRIGSGNWLVTVAIRNRKDLGNAPEVKIGAEDCIYQIGVSATSYQGSILPYRSTSNLNQSDEEVELDLRFKDSETYAVGHGISVTWTKTSQSVEVALDPLPDHVVPPISARAGSGNKAFSLAHLASIDTNTAEVCGSLSSFIDDYESWSAVEREKYHSEKPEWVSAGNRIVARQESAISRMRKAVTELATPQSEQLRKSFALGMHAMREQMLQSKFNADVGPGIPRTDEFDDSNEPEWRPFQLGFILTSLLSSLEANHPDRSTVDLIWFPTGGGKTEAYLGLAAIVMWWRRFEYGAKGGGTAVLTRYTLRLLAAQQFQRAATLICALERTRLEDPRAGAVSPFTIGLWVGNSTTPSTSKKALEQLDELYKVRIPENPFQLTQCPWCSTRLMPEHRVSDQSKYGAKSVAGQLVLHCTSATCLFNDRLPVEVVDEQIYDNPPTIVLGTVDKFARITFVAESGRLFGGKSGFLSPSLVIQDELHLLSGPLGTTVGIFETAVLQILALNGGAPKIVASTATIKEAEQQVRALYGSPVEIFPPSGVSETDSYFAAVDTTKPGRHYLGLMPQSFTQSTSMVQTMSALLEVPDKVEHIDQDDYWTVVAYHNSLRELGRTVTIVQDDIKSRMAVRSSSDTPTRQLKDTVELTGQVAAFELKQALDRLSLSTPNAHAVDVVVSTNMLSVGIDVPRLALMLMNGQPKSTSEYIQATSRVGRGSVPGVIVTLYRQSRPRDRSYYEQFHAYHNALYKFVEPTSVTPWSISSRRRTLASVLVAMYRHLSGFSENSGAASFKPEQAIVARIAEMISAQVQKSDPREQQNVEAEIRLLINQWEHRVSEEQELKYEGHGKEPSLTKHPLASGRGWPVINSMRNVDSSTAIIVAGERTSKNV